jgi:hypothetical protein
VFASDCSGLELQNVWRKSRGSNTVGGCALLSWVSQPPPGALEDKLITQPALLLEVGSTIPPCHGTIAIILMAILGSLPHRV